MFGPLTWLVNRFIGRSDQSASNAVTAGVTIQQRLRSMMENSGVVGTGEMGGTRMRIFTANGTWIRPPGVNTVRVICAGGGGGGGAGCNSGAAAGGGGGGGGSGLITINTVNVSANQTVTIGNGGNGGITHPSEGGTNGGNGAVTSFGALSSASGGNGGTVGFNDGEHQGGRGGNGLCGGGGGARRGIGGVGSGGLPSPTHSITAGLGTHPGPGGGLGFRNLSAPANSACHGGGHSAPGGVAQLPYQSNFETQPYPPSFGNLLTIHLGGLTASGTTVFGSGGGGGGGINGRGGAGGLGATGQVGAGATGGNGLPNTCAGGGGGGASNAVNPTTGHGGNGGSGLCIVMW